MATAQRSYGAARDYLEKKFGGRFTELESSPALAATAAAITGNNPDRLGLLIVNLGANTGYFGLRPNVSASNGFALAANGGSVSLSVDEDFTLVTRELFGIGPGGASQLYVLELVRDILSD